MITAIVEDDQRTADRVLDDFITELKSRGMVVKGFIQKQLAGVHTPCNVELECVNTGHGFSIAQSLGNQSTSCRLDLAAVDQLAMDLVGVLNEATDIIVINRYGKSEAQGRGFCCVLERAVELSIPVVTVVKPEWRFELQRYAAPWVQTVGCCQQSLMRVMYPTAQFAYVR